jgi:hypothetical protein
LRVILLLITLRKSNVQLKILESFE